MDIALAIKYGGAPVSADDCDETSYRRLGLTCSCCKDLVRWIPPQEREIKGVVYPVKPHFRHFPTKDPVVVANCERRVSVYTREEVERLAKKATQQRLALFQRWFWQVIDSHITRLDLSPDNDLEDIMFFKGEFEGYQLEGWLKGFVEEFAKIGAQEYAERFLKEYENPPEALVAEIVAVCEEDSLIPDWIEEMRRLARHQLHKHIVREAIAFLGNKRSQPILRAIVMFLLTSSDAFNPLMDGIGKNPEAIQTLAAHLVLAIAEFLALVPWADEFERVKGAKDIPAPNRTFNGLVLMLMIEKRIELEQQKRRQQLQTGEILLSQAP